MKEMIKTATRKGKSIDEIISQMPTPQLDPPKVKVESSRIRELLSLFEKEYFPNELTKPVGLSEGELLGIVLKPEEIPLIVQCLTEYESHFNFKTAAGEFLSKVLQESYDAGFNNFALRMPFATNWLYHVIKGTLERHLSLDVFNAGDHFGSFSEFLTARLQNPGDFCGYQSSRCQFLVQGDVNEFGYGASHITATIEGRAKQLGSNAQFSSFKCTTAVNIPGGSAKECEFILETITRFYLGIRPIDSGNPEHCLYAIQDQEAALKLAKVLPKGNKIICGETLVRDYDD